MLASSSLDQFLAFISHASRILADNWLGFTSLLLIALLLRRTYVSFLQRRSTRKSDQTYTATAHTKGTIPHLNLSNTITAQRRQPQPPASPSDDVAAAQSPKSMRHHKKHRRGSRKKKAAVPVVPKKPRQPFDMFLVLDIEGTCNRGSDFNFPNEIIEFPVCLMRWKDKADDGTASELEVIDEFRSFVRPTWRPVLTDFCKELTGITQEQVDPAPLFPDVLAKFEEFLMKHGLVDETGERLTRFCWCSDGPFDVRDFVVKQCFISDITMPKWLQGDVLDVRTIVLQWLNLRPSKAAHQPSIVPAPCNITRRSLNISAQLEVLDLPTFQGRQHSGIDDTRNIARIVTELARQGVPLLPNTVIHPGRRWPWMGKQGQVLEDYVT